MSKRLVRFLLQTAMPLSTILSAGGIALAQDKASTSTVEEVTVTATRVVREGYTAPTPTTVLNKTDLQLGGVTTIGEALAYFPSERATFSHFTSTGTAGGPAGANIADLRGLGNQRTLNLIDGQRPVFTTATGFSLDTIPISLVQRVDVVTGGASAAWGSDAVAGVINVVMDDNFTGMRASFQYGADATYSGSPYGDGAEYKGDVAFGGHFGGNDRGHYMIGLQYDDSAPLGPRPTNPGLQYGFIANPAFTATNGQPQQILVPRPAYSNASFGGLIVSGPLAGTAFGPGGTPYAFQYGQYRSGSMMSGGEADTGIITNYTGLQDGLIAKDGYGRVSYDILDNLKVTASLLYSNRHTSAPLVPNFNLGNITILSGNPFIPASVQTAMTANKLPSITIGRLDTDFGLTVAQNLNTAVQGTLGLSGSFGSKWTWDAYYSYGENQAEYPYGAETISNLFAQSVDAVTSPTTGKPVCRVALTQSTTACVPVNLFGFGSPSQAALSYFLGQADEHVDLVQHDFAANIRGEPFSLWAGPVSIAAGGEFRRESISQTADPLSLGNRFAILNWVNLSGAYSVAEGYLDTVVPLLRDLPFAHELDFNGAVRVSAYNRAGNQTTWKLGFTDDVSDDLRLRATESQDIRAPNLSELYSAALPSFNPVQNPFTSTSTLVPTFTGGNPNLQPETAHTTTMGAVLHPTWIPGFETSIDWYAIDVTNAISSLSGQAIVTYCFDGQTNLCSQITPNPLTNPKSVITQINATSLNFAKLNTSGLDFEATYRLDLNSVAPVLPGTLKSHLLVNYVDKFTQVTGIILAQAAGLAGGVPRWQGTLDEAYTLDQLMIDVRARYVGAVIFSNTVSNNYNHISDETYWDLGVQYAVTPDQRWVVYGNLLNAFNRKTPLGFGQAGSGGIFYNTIGTSYNVGVRVSF